jgi:hypothetical protein
MTVVQRLMQQHDVDRFNATYILGSWYGNMSLIMGLENFPTDTMINVDTNSAWVKHSRKLAQQLGLDNQMQYMVADANQLDYRQALLPSLIVNTSCNDMSGTDWFKNIPQGAWVALQARDQADSENQWESLKEFASDWPLKKVLYQGQIQLRDPETAYTRFLVVGVR